jgi:ferric-dicitrate binding protein FerR (iron transport regulator)
MPFHDAETYFQDPLFLRWIRASGPEEASLWKRLLAKYSGQSDELRQARYLFREWERTERQHELPDAEARLATAWQVIQDGIRADSERPSFRRIAWGRWLAAACAVLALGGWVWWQQPAQNPELTGGAAPKFSYRALLKTARQQQALLETHNTSSAPQTIVLPDGSEVRLSSGSRLSYPAQFDAPQREVFLTGDAFFEVRKNPAKPFFVYANEVVTKVLGTSFRVHAYDEARNVIVTVKTGQVSVYARTTSTRDPQTRTPTLVLTPNQRAVYLRDAVQLRKDLIEQPAPLVSPGELGRLVFEETPVTTVFEALERAYGVHIVYDAEALAECTLTATLNDESLYEKLDLISKTLGLRHEVMDAQIVITGRGCR